MSSDKLITNVIQKLYMGNSEIVSFRIAKKILEENAKWLKAHPEVKVIIEGHCDERGSEEYNLALGEKRAKSARDYLISLGISPERLSIISYGESMPLDPRHCEEAWAKNRRAHFAIKK